MKTALWLFTFLLASSAWALCDAGLCIGDRVVDTDDAVGEILDLYGETAKISIDGYGVTSFFRSYAVLAKAVPYVESVCSGERYIDPQNRNILVVEVFANGKVRWAHGGTISPKLVTVDEIRRDYRLEE